MKTFKKTTLVCAISLAMTQTASADIWGDIANWGNQNIVQPVTGVVNDVTSGGEQLANDVGDFFVAAGDLIVSTGEQTIQIFTDLASDSFQHVAGASTSAYHDIKDTAGNYFTTDYYSSHLDFSQLDTAITDFGESATMVGATGLEYLGYAGDMIGGGYKSAENKVVEALSCDAYMYQVCQTANKAYGVVSTLDMGAINNAPALFGRVWGVNGANQIFTRDEISGQWIQVAGGLKQIDVAANGRVWGVNDADQIFTRDGLTGQWQNIAGGLKQLSVAADGRVWGVNGNDLIFTRDGINGSWVQIGGNLKQVAVAANGDVWGVNSNDDIFYRYGGVNGYWAQVPGKLKQIAVAPNGQVWGVNSNDDIFTREGYNGNWQHIPGKLKEISIGTNGQVWGVNAADQIFKRWGVNGGWEGVAGGLKWVTSQ